MVLRSTIKNKFHTMKLKTITKNKNKIKTKAANNLKCVEWLSRVTIGIRLRERKDSVDFSLTHTHTHINTDSTMKSNINKREKEWRQQSI